MELLYICGYKINIENGKIRILPSYGMDFWQKYLKHFNTIKIVGEENKNYKTIQLDDSRIKAIITPRNSRPNELINDFRVKRILKEEILKSDCILIKPYSRKGLMAIEFAKKYNKPYIIEFTGDISQRLKYTNNFLEKIYAPFFLFELRRKIKHCNFALYVTNTELQKKYPIIGLQCGCSDVTIDKCDSKILNKRICRIKAAKQKYIIGLVGTIHGKGKGIGTALKALNTITKFSIEFRVIGNGEDSDKKNWEDYAENINFIHKLVIYDVVDSREEMFQWLDDIDIYILPSLNEGLPRSTIEAMSRALPCITTNVCGEKELIDKKWLHEPNDFRKLSLLIENMLTNTDEMLEAAHTNFEKAKNYERNKLDKKRDAFFSNVVEYVGSTKDISI